MFSCATSHEPIVAKSSLLFLPSFLPATGVIECWLAGLTDDDVAFSHAETAKDASVAGHD